MIIIGSDFSEICNGYMEGGVRIAREKIYQQLQKDDPLEYLYESKLNKALKQ